MKPLSSLLALTILLGTPGLPAYQAAAAVVRPAPVPASAVSAWGPMTGELLFRSGTAAQPFLTPRLETVLGQARFTLESAPRTPRAAASLAFVKHLPAAYAADPAAFAKLEPAAQAALLETAVAAASAEYQDYASEFLVSVGEGKLTAAQARELDELAGASFYLHEYAGSMARGMAAAERERRSLNLGRRIAGLLGRSTEVDYDARDAAEADSEVNFILAGAARLAKEGGDVQGALAPYAARALDGAAERMSERVRPPAALYGRVLTGHRNLFGGKAAKPLLRALRPAGQWTPFIAALSLHAAERLAAKDADSKVLKDAAADWDLRLAIPSWRAEAASGAASVAQYLASVHGETAPEFPTRGRLFTAFGIPVRADMGFYLFAAFMAFQLANNFFAKASNPLLLGFSAVALLYVTLLGHEFGHALVARAFGVKTHGIALNFLGGAAYIEREPRRPLADFLIALAGPAVNFVVAAALYPVLGMLDPGGLRAVLAFTLYGNVLLGAMNLIPAYPMDGGRILRSGLAALLGDHYKATHITARIGMVLGLAAALFGWAQVTMMGDWSAVFTVVIGLFIVMVSRAALYHPGTDIVEPAAKK